MVYYANWVDTYNTDKDKIYKEMTKWTKEHPVAAHLINMAIMTALIFVLFCVWKVYYGDIIIETNENTKKIMESAIRW